MTWRQEEGKKKDERIITLTTGQVGTLLVNGMDTWMVLPADGRKYA